MNKLYHYIEHTGDFIPAMYVLISPLCVKPIMWSQNGRYGWISKVQVWNMVRRQRDLDKQQKGYAKDEPMKLEFHWGDTAPLDPVTVRLMRATSQ